MRRILREIQDGMFAREWILENAAARPHFDRLRERGRMHPIEDVGRRLREMMVWIKTPQR
jgi:ketol-acid reductoisomerase